jgi:SAM-dependent methyltransferase
MFVDAKSKAKYLIAKAHYLAAIPSQFYLAEDQFDLLEAKFKPMGASTFCDYSHDGQTKLAQTRYEELMSIAGNMRVSSVCEIGPGSGMLLNEFTVRGVDRAFAVDIEDRLYEKHKSVRVILSGVHEMDIPDESVDLVYSYDALEHIPRPNAAVFHCLRILRPGGLLFLKIGGTYFSPWGYHFYAILRIPYIHVLFPEKLLLRYAERIQLDTQSEEVRRIPWTNGVAGTSYFAIGRELPDSARLLDFSYDFDVSQWRIIRDHAHIFKAKRVNFDDFFIGGISLLIRKEAGNVYHR